MGHCNLRDNRRNTKRCEQQRQNKFFDDVRHFSLQDQLEPLNSDFSTPDRKMQ
jgi:hypothetical protein